MHKRLILLSCLSLSVSTVFSQARSKRLYEANETFKQGKFKEAEAQYRDILQQEKINEAGYNLGNALYEQKSFSDAAKQFESTAKNTSKQQVKANAFYNEGNAFLSEKKYEDAIRAYKQALRENPGFEQARYNLAYAQQLLKKQQEQQQDKPKQDPKSEKNKQENKDQQADKNKDKPKGDNPQEQPKQAPQAGKLNKHQADELLNALQREEQKVRDKKDKQKGHPVSPEKDW